MEIILNYSQIQLEAAIEFISSNNLNFLEKDEEIKQTILDGMVYLTKDVDAQFYSTMGFTLVADREFESIDSDENVCRIEILIDPSMHLYDYMDEDDIQAQTLETEI
jgi:hypothetical protein